MSSLDELQGALITYTNLQAEQVEADAVHPVRQLLIKLNHPEHETAHESGHEYVLRVFCANDVLEGLHDEISSVFYFVARYPDSIPAPFMRELNRLLSVINHLLPLGNLELHPEEGLFFRHMLLNEERSLDGLLGLDIVLGLEALLPKVFDWVHEVLTHVAPGEIQEQLRDKFKDLLTQIPILETLALPPPPEPHHNPGPLPQPLLYSLGLILSLLVGALTSSRIGPIWGLMISLQLFLASRVLTQAYQRRYHQNRERREQQRQLRFYWQLLEVESIKLAHQDQSLDLQQQQILQKLEQLSAQPVDYPGDILRLRDQMRSLRQLQSQLNQRSHQLRQKREELEQSRFQLLRQRLSLMPDAEPINPALNGLADSFGSEDLLMQNLVVTLEYLDFQIQTLGHADNHSPVVQVSPRAGSPAITIRWLRRWHLAGVQPQNTWMLCFDLTLPNQIPPEAWPRIHELLRVFNRFLPLGALICDYARNRLTLRYRFVRLRGDLSTLLVMEILEVMSCFGERLQQRLSECISQSKHLETILDETEQDFQTLQL